MAFWFLLLFLLLLTAGRDFANRASPYLRGTSAATAFTSRDISILSEKLHIRIYSAFRKAAFTVEYTIQSNVAGNQIPLLFLAEGYADSFQVWVDGQPVKVEPIPEKYTQFSGSPYAAFEGSKEAETPYLSEDQVHISWEETYGSLYRLRDLKYFETDISKGVHIIQVTYGAAPWINRSAWIKSPEFRYSLSPAKHWRSFGQLHITVVQEGAPKPMRVQFGLTTEKWTGGSKTWAFRKLPADFISLSHTPAVRPLAAFFVELEPLGIILFLGLLFLALHLRAIRSYRKRHLQMKHTPVVIWGSLLLPFLLLFIFVTSYYFIDWLLGDAAGGQHGYIFLMVFLYPVVMPLYGIAMGLADRYWKHRYSQNISA